MSRLKFVNAIARVRVTSITVCFYLNVYNITYSIYIYMYSYISRGDAVHNIVCVLFAPAPRVHDFRKRVSHRAHVAGTLFQGL